MELEHYRLYKSTIDERLLHYYPVFEKQDFVSLNDSVNVKLFQEFIGQKDKNKFLKEDKSRIPDIINACYFFENLKLGDMINRAHKVQQCNMERGICVVKSKARQFIDRVLQFKQCVDWDQKFESIDWASQTMKLLGEAGTGKTQFFISVLQLIADMRLQNKLSRFLFLAPTNKAVLVLRNKLLQLPDYRKFQIVTCTLHQAMGLTLDPLNDNQLLQKGKGQFMDKPWDFIVVDEISMVSDNLLDRLMPHCHNQFTIFVGDRKQLPPVEQEQESAVFSNDQIPQIELNIVLRQLGQTPLYNFIQDVKNQIQEKQTIQWRSFCLTFQNKNPNWQEQITFIDNDEHFTQLLFSQLENFQDARLLVHKNEMNKGEGSVQDYLRKLQTYRVNKGYAHFYRVGGLLTFKKIQDQNQFTKFIYDSESIANIQESSTGDEFTLEAKMNKSKTFDGWEFDLWTVQNIYSGTKSRIYLPKWLFVDDQFVHQQFQKNMMFFYGPISTIHKSQGSTYNCVFIDLQNINPYNSSYHQLLYVALTRSRDKLVLYNKSFS